MLLDERHRDIAQIALAAAGRRYGVAFAGGGALQVHEVSARRTQDVDLFVKRAGQVRDAAAAIGEALELAGYKVAVPYANEGMVEFEVSPPPGGGDPVQVQVAHFAYGATVDTVVGPTVTLDYLAARKAVALMERHQVRDYVDIASLVDAGYGIGALLERGPLAGQRALHQFCRFRCRDQAAHFVSAGGQCRVNRVRRDRFAELGAGGGGRAGERMSARVRILSQVTGEGGRRVVEIKTTREIDAIGAAGQVVADILAAARAVAAPGVTLRELDSAAREVLAKAGATSPFLNYHPKFAPVPYPAVICTSVNDVALHGIPGDYRLREGDLLSVDAGATLDGWVGDAAISFAVGSPLDGDTELIAATEAALAAGIAAARPGGRLGDISAAIGKIGRAGGYGISTDLGGHGVGRTMHEDPHIPNRGKAGRGLRLVPGLVLAIEPWFIASGSDGIYLDEDGWTIRTADGSRAAHAEHTIAITDDGPVILTAASP